MDILGLPLHPLVVHLVVVALPLGALATAAAVVSPTFRTRYGTLALSTLSVGALAAGMAKLSGEALAETVPLPERHAFLGNVTLAVGLATAVLAWVWWLLERRQAKAPAGQVSFWPMLTGGLVAAAAIAVAVLAVLTGHAGAQATWTSRLPVPVASTTPDATFTLADVAEHNTPADCWAAVGDGVYDLTAWAAAHPGGAGRITALCGTDATEQFTAQHRDAARPNAQLDGLQVGTLG
ncbi:MAG: cytochrome b5 domain-containing protein [Propionibacteriaceae bacterium]|nr:cytochrome b5 domain-containing protein [Propionibacteriaceae bacterium]